MTTSREPRSPMPLELHFGAFGKLPTQGDFVRVDAHAHLIRPLDLWIQDGMIYARHVLGPRFQALYEEQLFHRFVFRPKGGGYTVLGVLRGASDAHQRYFPFVTYALVEGAILDQMPSLLPALVELLYPVLEARMLQAPHARTASELIALMRQGQALELDVQEHARRYTTFLSDWEVEELAEMRTGQPSLVMKELLHAILAFRREGRVAHEALELPFSSQAGVQSFALRFWMELQLLGFSLMPMLPSSFSLFWSTGERAEGESRVLLSHRPPSTPLLASLMKSGAGQATVWTPGAGVSPYSFCRERGPDIPLGTRLVDVLRAVAPSYPSPCSW